MYCIWKAFSDRYERKYIREFLRPGKTAVDIGANIGVYTQFFSSLVTKTGRIYAFEPHPSNYMHLQENTRDHTNVTRIQAAVGNQNGEIKLFISSELNVDHCTFDRGDGRQWIKVPIISLDEYFPVGHHVDLIKIDVQGYELSVLQGAKRVLQENHDIQVLIEFWPYGFLKAGVDPSYVIELINLLGFEIRAISNLNLFDGSGLDPNNPNHFCNLIISRPPLS